MNDALRLGGLAATARGMNEVTLELFAWALLRTGPSTADEIVVAAGGIEPQICDELSSRLPPATHAVSPDSQFAPLSGELDRVLDIASEGAASTVPAGRVLIALLDIAGDRLPEFTRRGITADLVRRLADGSDEETERAQTVWSAFSQNANAILVRAWDEARERGRPALPVDVVAVALQLLAEPGRAFLEQQGVDLARAAQRVTEIRSALPTVEPLDAARSSQQVSTAVRRTILRALDLGSSGVTELALLLGVIDSDRPLAAAVLGTVDLNRVLLNAAAITPYALYPED